MVRVEVRYGFYFCTRKNSFIKFQMLCLKKLKIELCHIAMCTHSEHLSWVILLEHPTNEQPFEPALVVLVNTSCHISSIGLLNKTYPQQVHIYADSSNQVKFSITILYLKRNTYIFIVGLDRRCPTPYSYDSTYPCISLTFSPLCVGLICFFFSFHSRQITMMDDHNKNGLAV